MRDPADPHIVELLAALGLQGAAAGRSDAVPRPRDTVARGFVASTAAGPPRSADVPAVALLGGEALWDGADLLLELPGGAWLTHPADLPDGVTWDAPHALRVDERVANAPFAVIGEAGAGVLVEPAGPGGGAATVTVIDTRPLVVDPAPSFTVDLEPLLALTPDAWLADTARARHGAGDPWDHAVALGHLARLERLEGPALKAAVTRLLAGEEPPLLVATRAACVGLGADSLDDLEDLALAAVDDLHDDLAEVVASIDPDDPDWVAALRALFGARDDLESACAVLALAGRGARTGPAVAALDEEAASWVRALPVPAGWTLSERLARAGVDAPEGWWILT